MKAADSMTEAQALELLNRIDNCEPAITEALAWETDRITRSKDFGVAQRVALLTSAKGGEWYRSIKSAPQADAEVFASMHQMIRLHIQALRNLTSILEVAEMRLMMVLAAREDGLELFDRAVAEVGSIALFTPPPDPAKRKKPRGARRAAAVPAQQEGGAA